MKQKFWMASIIGLISTCSTSCNINKELQKGLFKQLEVDTTVSANIVFQEVKKQFDIANEQIKKFNKETNQKDTLELAEADVVFDNIRSDQASGSINIVIFKAGYTLASKKETTLTYSLINTATTKPGVLPFIRHTTTLSNLIYQSFRQLNEIDWDISGKNKTEKDLTAQIAFTIEHTATGEITFAIGQVTPDLNVSRDVQNTHTIILKFILVQKK